MKKLHWGHAILIFFIFYISYLAWTVIASRQVDHSLVLDDYYALDLAYQDHYHAAANALNADHQPNVEYNEELQQVVIDFQSVKISNGILQLYRPSDAALDQYYNLDKADSNNRYVFDVSLLDQGKWIAKTQWSQEDKKYYKEDVILLSNP